MGPFLLAWIVGEGIISYRAVKRQKAPPGPGQLLLSSGVFVILGIIAESPAARPLAITLAWGFDIAAFMNLFGVGGEIKEQPGGNGNPGTWPPKLAPNTVIIPSGK